ncbi:MAG: hypothetical protein C4K49_05255 [Candidatus Thorarchaeota archaeon]|nr:MAG: hypothetical protein C4K49_05255 [Candidatus Thorarchaeota archaeon]
MNKSVLVRLIVLAVGLIGAAYVYLSFIIRWLPYADEVPFWYMTSNGDMNFLFATGIVWMLLALVAWPLTSPSDPKGAALALLGYSLMAVGYGFVAPTRSGFSGYYGLNPLLGYLVIAVGAVVLILAYVLVRRTKAPRSAATTP